MIGSRVLDTNHPHIREYTNLVLFTLACTKPLPTASDFEKFDIVRDRMDASPHEWEFCIVGTITCDGKREWVIYAKDGQQLMDRLFLEFSEFAPQMEMEIDPAWDYYRGLVKQR